MYSRGELQSNSDHTQTDRPKVHQITVMENKGTKKASDERGDYGKANGGEGVEGAGEVDEKTEETSKNTDKGAEKVTEKDKGEGKKDTVIILDPTPLDRGKEDCCTRFKKFCSEYKLVVALICLLIFLAVLFLALYIDSRSKAAKVCETPPTSTPGVTGTKTTPGPGTTEPSAPVAVLNGMVTTTENYTVALKDPTSLAYKALENKFIAEMMAFYAKNKAYIAYYQDTVVSEFERDLGQVIVHFQIHFSQLDNDGEVPDAHSVLLDYLQPGSPPVLGTLMFIGQPTLTKG